MMPVLESLEDIFRGVLGIEPPSPETDLIKAGLLDSLMLIMLLSELEVAYSIRVPLEELDLEEVQTLERLTALVQRLSSAESSQAADGAHQLLVPLRDGSSGPPLFLMPNVMGVALGLRPLAFALRTQRPIYGLAPLPPERRSGPVRVESLAEAYVQAIRSVGDPTGCVIAGVSFGGLVAYETARRLRDAGEPVGRVILLDTRAAARGLGRGMYWAFRLAQPLRAARDILPDLRARIPDVIRRTMPTLRAWAQRLVSSGSDADEATPWSTLAHQAELDYLPGRYDGAVTLFVTDRPPLSTFRPETVWSRVVDGEFSIERIPGTHLDFLRGRWLDGVAERLSKVIETS
jgi:thioesterase domain-containing protein/acyl carrier protein